MRACLFPSRGMKEEFTRRETARGQRAVCIHCVFPAKRHRRHIQRKCLQRNACRRCQPPSAWNMMARGRAGLPALFPHALHASCLFFMCCQISKNQNAFFKEFFMHCLFIFIYQSCLAYSFVCLCLLPSRLSVRRFRYNNLIRIDRMGGISEESSGILYLGMEFME